MGLQARGPPGAAVLCVAQGDVCLCTSVVWPGLLEVLCVLFDPLATSAPVLARPVSAAPLPPTLSSTAHWV